MLNIAHTAVTEGVNGPGRRYTVWFQGCARDCEGCFNPELRPFIPKILVSPLDLAGLALARETDGITLSGGEPFEQAGEAALFVKAVKTARPTMTAIAFTGYTVEELRATGGDAAHLLDALDLVIDGPFLSDRLSSGGLKGSENQRLIALSRAGEKLLAEISGDGAPMAEVSISASGDVIISGFPPEKLVAAIRKKLSGQR